MVLFCLNQLQCALMATDGQEGHGLQLPKKMGRVFFFKFSLVYRKNLYELIIFCSPQEFHLNVLLGVLSPFCIYQNGLSFDLTRTLTSRHKITCDTAP